MARHGRPKLSGRRRIGDHRPQQGSDYRRGRNIWPQDLEWAVEKIEHVRAGDVAAFAVPDQDDSEQVVLVVECRLSDPAARAALRREISAVVQRSAGVSCEVVLTRPNALTLPPKA